MKRERKYAKVIGIVVISFSVCWLPVVTVITCLYAGLPSTLTVFYVRTAVGVLFVSNSLINSIIYIWKIPELNKKFRRLISCYLRGAAVAPELATDNTFDSAI